MSRLSSRWRIGKRHGKLAIVDRRIARLLDRPELTRVSVNVWSLVRFVAAKVKAGLGPKWDFGDGLPRPPDWLQFQVTGDVNWEWYFQSGRFLAAEIQESLARETTTFLECGPVLDFGCGSGRIARHFAPYADAPIFGSDSNRRLVAWCEKNLKFAKFAVNNRLPPLPFDKESFGLVYAYSVFTHLPSDAQEAWRDELCRVLRPGGYLWVTVHSEIIASKFTPDEEATYARGELVVRFAGAAGNNFCTAYPPAAYLSELFSEAHGWSILDHRRSGPAWEPQFQDQLLVRRN
jgi:SAM-dependent methyltransferase